MLQLTDFTAEISVARSGYRWTSNFESRVREQKRGAPKDDDGLVLVEQVPGDVRTYDPFVTAKALWRDFARLEPTQTAILDFADRYGALQSTETTNFSDWLDLMARWKFAFELWESIEAYKTSGRKNVEAISRFVRWQKKGKALHWLVPVPRNGREWRPALEAGLRVYQAGELLRPAETLLTFLFVDQLRWQLAGEPAPRTNLTFAVFDDPERTISFKILVPDLIDVLWIQFAGAVMGQKQYRDCEMCGGSFEVKGDRTDKRFCSDACRMKAHRRNRKKAIERHRLGWSLKEISSEVGSPIATVKKWLKQEK